MWHDNVTETDLIGFSRFVDAVAGLVVDEELLPVTIGLFGDWGSGKSSVLSMIEQGLDADDVLTVRFDSWTFEGFDDAKAALMSSIVDALAAAGEGGDEKGIAEKVKALCRRIDWVRLAGLASKGIVTLSSPVGLLMGGLGVAGDVLSGVAEGNVVQGESEGGSVAYETVRDLRASFGELVEAAGVSAVVVLIDDLDRCLPESLVGVLEAIKLFLAVPKTAFVVAADERIVRAAVALRYPGVEADQEGIAQEYLDKLVQIPIVLPPMNDVETETFIYLLYAQKALDWQQLEMLLETVRLNQKERPLIAPLNYGVVNTCLGDDVAASIADDFALSQAIAPVLGQQLGGNPRLVKRFLNGLELRMAVANAQGIALDRSVMAKLMVLERFHRDRFEEVHRWQRTGSGIALELGILEEMVESTEDDTDQKTELAAWIEDDGLRGWIESRPKLAEVNLASYFYLTRDTLGVSGLSTGRRLTHEQDEILGMLLSGSRAQQRRGAERAMALVAEDGMQLFEVLVARIRGSLGRVPDTKACIELALRNEAIAGRLIAEWQNISPSDIDPALAPQVGELVQTHAGVREAAVRLVEGWGSSGNTLLQRASQQILKDL